ncbi:MAG: fibronectin type III domain-containing protein, partial [Dehalococcoidia bacterium]|nr:fibronectin type III domain-containing protein [Dehalococcoidia bacterium]
MRTMMREKLLLPILMAVIAAVVGGLFASLGGPDPAGDTQATTTDPIVYFRFMPPVGDDDTEVTLSCGWHAVCDPEGYEYSNGFIDTDDDENNYPRRAHGLDFESRSRAPAYLRGYGHAPGTTGITQPVTVKTFRWARTRTGSEGTRNFDEATVCWAVEAAFFNSAADAQADTNHIGRYRLYHIDTTNARLDQVYRPNFSSAGAWNPGLPIATVVDPPSDNCHGTGAHIHAVRDENNNNWIDNENLYPTESETEAGEGRRTYNNKAPLNWTHQLCLSASCPIPPDEISNVMVPFDSIGLTSAVLSWEAPDAGSGTIDGYQFTSVSGSFPPTEGDPVEVAGTSGGLTGLSPNTVYHVQVRAKSIFEGETLYGPWSYYRSFSTDSLDSNGEQKDKETGGNLAAPRTTGAPNDGALVIVRTSDSGGGALGASGAAGASDTPAVTRYEVRYRPVVTYRMYGEGWKVIDIGTATSHTIPDLTPFQYEVQARARNDNGHGNWSESAFVEVGDTGGCHTCVNETRIGYSTSSQSAARSAADAAVRAALPAGTTDISVTVRDLPISTSSRSVSETRTGSSTVNQAAANRAAEDAARAALPRGTTSISATVTDLSSATTGGGPVSETRRGSSTASQAAANSAAERAAKAALPSGTTGVTSSVSALDSEDTTETRRATRTARSADRDKAIKTAQQAAVQATRFGDMTPPCAICQTVTTTHTVTTESVRVTTPVTASRGGSTEQAAEDAAEAAFEAYAEGRPGYVSHSITSNTASQQSDGSWLATATGTVTWTQTQYVATVTATRTRYTTTYNAEATARGTAPSTRTYNAEATARGTLQGTTTYRARATATGMLPSGVGGGDDSAPTIGTPTATTLPVLWTSDVRPTVTGYDLRYISQQEDETMDANWTEVDVGLVTSYTLT